VTFEEEQRFRQWWLWLLVAIPVLLTWAGFGWQIVLGRTFGDRPAPDWVIVPTWLAFGIALPVWLWSLCLVTRVDGDGLHVRFRLLGAGRRFGFDEIAGVESIRCRPLRDFGGWGVRWAGRRGRAYSVSGNRGVAVDLQDGGRWVIGSQRPDELAAAVAAGMG